MKRSEQALLVLTALTFVVALFRFDGPAKGYWDTYITAPAMFMNQEPVDFVLTDGSPTWDIQLQGRLPHDLVDRDGFGIITKDQRIGGGITASLPYAFFGQLGFRVLFAFTIALIIPLGFLVCREILPGRPFAAITAGIALAWNPFMLSVDRLNANAFSMPLMLLVLLLILRPRVRPVALGLVFGVLAGIRNEAVCFVPAICYWMLRPDGQRSFPQRFGRLFVVGTLTVVALSPVLYWKWYAFGNPLMHPSQYPHFQGFRPTFVHSLFGASFEFNGLFNWPLHTDLVRTPHFGYPTYLLFPLVTARAFGLVLSAMILLGVWSLWRDRRPLALFFLLWMAPVYVLFGPQENWEEVKMTFMLLAYAPLAPFLAAGAVAAWDGFESKRMVAVFGGLCVFVFLSVKLIGMIEVPQDTRWYERFPNADLEKNPSAQEGLAELERNDHTYFQSYETEAEIARERAKLTAGWPWPAQYLPSQMDISREWWEMRMEAGKRELRVTEIWGYIYGLRKDAP